MQKFLKILFCNPLAKDKDEMCVKFEKVISENKTAHSEFSKVMNETLNLKHSKRNIYHG